MKAIPVGFLAAVALLLAGHSAGAAPIAVGFATVGPDPVDITARYSPAGLTLDGVNFLFDPFVDNATCAANPATPGCADFATVDENGVLGTTWGVLSLGFDQPVSALSLDFYLWGVSAPAGDFGLLAIFDNGEDDQIDGSFNPDGVQFGSLAHVGQTPFNSVSLYFSLEAPLFTIDNVSYEPASQPVPEPATLLLTTSGVLALVRTRARSRRAARLAAVQGCLGAKRP